VTSKNEISASTQTTTGQGRTVADITLQPIGLRPLQAAAVTGLTRTRIFAAIRAKELTAHKDGRATIITLDELRRFVSTFPTVGRNPEKIVR
jgi:hypothetical protein